MSSILMLRSIWSVAESFAASWKLASVRFLASVRPQMSLEVLQPRVGLVASLKLQNRNFLVFLATSTHSNLNLPCICAVFHPCAGACERPACTAPWTAFHRASKSPIDKQTTFYCRECDRCWCVGRAHLGWETRVRSLSSDNWFRRKRRHRLSRPLCPLELSRCSCCCCCYLI